MTELELIRIYNVGRMRGLLPNTEDMNKYVYDELINATPKEYDTWYLIYGTYSSSGILEKCFQCNLNSFAWSDVKDLLLIDSTQKQKTFNKKYLKYLKNKRSKW